MRYNKEKDHPQTLLPAGRPFPPSHFIHKEIFHMKRVSAILGLVAIFAAVTALIICTITGASSGTILALLVCLIILPVLFYGLMLFARRNGREDGDHTGPKQ